MMVAALMFFVFALGLGGLGIYLFRQDAPGVGAVLLFVAMICFGGAYAFYRADAQMAESEVDRGQAVACVAEIVDMHDKRSMTNDYRHYQFRLRVQVPGRDTYETDSHAAVSPLTLGMIGADKITYHCLADRSDLKTVEVLWDRPVISASASPS
ncbi:hypothetical protein [Micromonospora citrea]|uniref:hypothetical protein n=1 Tax=Micromonospora citrea TaxID=47855 RepID=UPI00114C91E1|nr:hypothetical protein [Micromonospora citrea]